MIVVDMPDSYRNERSYVLDFIMNQVLGVDYEVVFRTNDSVPVVRIILPNNCTLQLDDILFQTPEKEWLASHVIPESPLPTVLVEDKISALLSDSELPIMFAGAEMNRHGRPWKRNSDSGIKINFDLLGAVFFMLTRYEEVAAPTFDYHDRYNSKHSLAVRNCFDMRPLADEYIALLRFFVLQLDPSVKIKSQYYSVELSHDLDRPYRFGSLSGYLKVFLGHILKRRSIGLTAEWLRQGVRRIRGREFDCFFVGLQTLLEISERHGLRSQINIMGAEGGLHDEGYDPAAIPLRETLKSAEARGHIIGFHPGYHTYNDPKRFAEERKRVEEGLGVQITRVRQHYLRMKVPSTWRMWYENQIMEDGSLGFPDRNGFRAGTSHAYTLFDLENHCELHVRETPLIVMDGALKAGFNESLGPDQAIVKANRLADLCKKYGGTFSLLWHNSSFNGDWAGWEKVYESIVKHSVELLDD